MNITLSVDEELIKKARLFAKAQGKSLNQMIRDHLNQVCQKQDGIAAAAEFMRLVGDGQGDLGGTSWTRDELHER